MKKYLAGGILILLVACNPEPKIVYTNQLPPKPWIQVEKISNPNSEIVVIKTKLQECVIVVPDSEDTVTSRCVVNNEVQ